MPAATETDSFAVAVPLAGRLIRPPAGLSVIPSGAAADQRTSWRLSRMVETLSVLSADVPGSALTAPGAVLAKNGASPSR